jgi:hypothetical protein
MFGRGYLWWANGPNVRQSLARPAKPSGPTFLRNPPIFSDRFTFRSRLSDAVMRQRVSSFHNGKF